MPRSTAVQGRADRVRRLGAVGAGRVFRHLHAPALHDHPRWRLARLWDPSPDSVRDALAGVPGGAPAVEVADSLQGLLDGGPEPLGGVLILSPPAHHVAQTLAALARRIPVLVEKPMALDRAGALRVVEAWRESGVPVQVGFNRRFRPPYRALRRWIAEAGRVHRVDASFEADVDRWGERSGGEPLLHDLAVHLFDLVRWLTGRELVEVEAEGGADGVRVHATLDDDTPVRITVGGRRGYREWVHVRADAGARFVHPGGIVPSRLVPVVGRGACAGAGSVLESLRARLLRVPGHTRRSLVDQLADFARRVDGWPGPTGADQDPARPGADRDAARRGADRGGSPAGGHPDDSTRGAGDRDPLVGAHPLDGLRAVDATGAALRSLNDGGRRTPVARDERPRASRTSRTPS
jgi:predicted dehydrogenase